MKNFIEGAIYKLKQATSVCVNGEEYVVSAVTGVLAIVFHAISMEMWLMAMSHPCRLKLKTSTR